MTQEPNEQSESLDGWSARLEIEVERSAEASVLGRRTHRGPLRIQRPFYPEGPACPHIYLLHPPGGLVGGDQLETRISVGALASALFTTPAAQKLYRSSGKVSRQRTQLQVGPGGALEWFPGETIAFDGARAKSVTRVVLDVGARFLGWEIVCFGRSASSLPFQTGELAFGFELYRQERPLEIDRSRIVGGSEALESAWGYQGLPVFGTFYAVSRESAELTELLSPLRDGLAGERVGVTAFEELLVIRAGASSVERVRALFSTAWELLRPRLLERACVPPRIWAL